MSFDHLERAGLVTDWILSRIMAHPGPQTFPYCHCHWLGGGGSKITEMDPLGGYALFIAAGTLAEAKDLGQHLNSFRKYRDFDKVEHGNYGKYTYIPTVAKTANYLQKNMGKLHTWPKVGSKK